MTESMPSDVSSVLSYYSDEVVVALAAALTIDDKFPEEVLNEIRNSFTHLARANAIGSEHDDYRKELESANRHLKRVCLDCLKICILVTSQRCESAIEALTEDVHLPNDVYNHMSVLRRRRSEIAAHEGQNPTHEVIEKLKSIFADYDEFYIGLDYQFAGSTAEMRKSARSRKSFRSGVIGFFLGVIGSLFASFIWSLATESAPAEAAQSIVKPLIVDE